MTKQEITPEEMAAGQKLIKPLVDALNGLSNEELGLAREAFAKSDECTSPWMLCVLKYVMLTMLSLEAARRNLRPEEWLVMPEDVKEV